MNVKGGTFLSSNVQIPRKPLARITGGLYLAFILALTLADTFGHVGVGDVDLAHEVLATDPARFAVGLTFAMLSAFLFVLAAWGLYVLLRPVNRELALLFLLLNAIGVAIQMASYIPLILAMLATDASGFAVAFSQPQIESLQRLSFDVQKLSFVTAQLFFATWLFPLGYLVYRSGFLPRLLGVLLILDGFAVCLWFLQGLLLPDDSALVMPGLALSFIAEAGLGLWLLLKGVKDVGDEPALAEPARSQ
jgi:hypothetical protein